MVKCNSYHLTEETRYLTEFEQGVRFAKTGKRITKEKVKVAHCWGTKECEECKCGGDRLKCDFYADVRKEARDEFHSRKFGEWISVKDELPPKKQRVLVYDKHGSTGIDWQAETSRIVGCWFVHSENSITHWMPLPELPKK